MHKHQPTFSDWTKRDPQPHQAQQAHQGHVSVMFWAAQNVTPQQAPKLKPSLSKVTFGPSSRLGPNLSRAIARVRQRHFRDSPRDLCGPTKDACGRTVAAIRKEHQNPEDYVHKWLCMESICATCRFHISLVPSEAYWTTTKCLKTYPPIIKRPIGRSKVHARKKDSVESPKLRKDFGHQGNKDKQILEFDPEIEQTLRKLRKQAKLQKQPHKISFEEVLEEFRLIWLTKEISETPWENSLVPLLLAVAVA
ncbi:hypothetical protein PIB30_040611 [Stylosanthes scabra]|uniref:Chromo domain-containing protein n=1 Tax=Stylosanthes scabra TaxID=79078 RepID=A0ABU6SEK0_9FABA|nr:hypothetical protein [Stylosanthes scabra]